MGKKPNNLKLEISSRQKVFMYSCLVPVFGTLPALMALISSRGSKQLKEIAQVSLILLLIWLSGYTMLGESSQITQGLSKATLTSTYFVLNLYLMWRLAQGKKISLWRWDRFK
ncbi:hypothetical protein Syn7502_01343 [Synechococcus sp. PCC 7502]|uniref:hypothetical protein n=1 Tax=Synechococcus sp. PCC 7502 TaxID=1173263 RepID=UPI00029FEF58|nr:hypothetical protein [Synechococcus sp. PCC 7502]AFY73435.1 hypothetical protein Syn7502_01343 [Synechococcus sp. PCC 7502]